MPPSSTTLATSLGGTTWRGVAPSSMMGGVPGMTIGKALNPGAGLLGQYHGRVVGCVGRMFGVLQLLETSRFIVS